MKESHLEDTKQSPGVRGNEKSHLDREGRFKLFRKTEIPSCLKAHASAILKGWYPFSEPRTLTARRSREEYAANIKS